MHRIPNLLNSPTVALQSSFVLNSWQLRDSIPSGFSFLWVVSTITLLATLNVAGSRTRLPNYHKSRPSSFKNSTPFNPVADFQAYCSYNIQIHTLFRGYFAAFFPRLEKTEHSTTAGSPVVPGYHCRTLHTHTLAILRTRPHHTLGFGFSVCPRGGSQPVSWSFGAYGKPGG